MTRLIGGRLAAATVFLVALVVLQSFTVELFPAIVGLFLIVLPVLQWSAAIFFARRSLERPDIFTVRLRAQDGTDLAIAQTMGAFLGVLVVLRQLAIIGPVDGRVFTIGLSFALVMLARPAVTWLLTFRPWRPIE